MSLPHDEEEHVDITDGAAGRALYEDPEADAPETETGGLRGGTGSDSFDPEGGEFDEPETFRRRLASQLTGCCETYSAYSAMSMCGLYGEDCQSGEQPSHDSGDEDCEMAGLSFIGVSFSVNTALGNPFSYQLCDQYPMENIIDRNYDYVMSMDEDGWLVGGGYKSFDYSGKMPYIDSSHTELLRIGSIDPEYGGTTIEQVYAAMETLSFQPFAIFPEYVKGGGGHDSGDDDGVPSSDVTLIVSVVETYEDNENYSTYEYFLDQIFDAMDAVGGGPCMDDHDTDPHVSMSRGVKFKSSYHEQQYFFKANLEVAVWQAMYPKGVVIGTSSYSNFPPEKAGKNRHYIGYGNLYFFFDRANITSAFTPNREMTSSEQYYAEMYMSGASAPFYESVTTVDFDYSGSGSGDKNYFYEHNPYSWDAEMARHDLTDGWDLPPNCEMEGEAFFGIPLSRASTSKLQSSSTFQEQFDFEVLLDRNYTYIQSFGTNHGWLVGELLNNGPGSIVDKDTAHIPIFYTGTTNSDMGGISLSDLVKVAKSIEFGTLYIKPAFVFQDEDGSIKLQFEADASSALGYLYDNLCKMLGIAWNNAKPYNDLGAYTSCAQHSAGDRAMYGCGPDNAGSGGFCPQMMLAYRVRFQSEDHAAAYLAAANNYVDYWRSMYPSGVAVGTTKFCPEGGCLGLFLNRMDIYNVYKPDGGGSWVEFNGGTFSPTISPAPTRQGGCDEPHNRHLDRCFRKQHKRKAAAAAWDSLGSVGQVSVLLIAFMSTTLSVSIFLARARKKKRRGESYVGFFVRDMKRRRKKKKKLRKKTRDLGDDLLDDGTMFSDDNEYRPPPPPRSGRATPKGPPKSSDRRGRSRSKTRSKSSSSVARSRAVTPVSLTPSASGGGSVSSRGRGRRSGRSRSRSKGKSSGRSRSRRRSSGAGGGSEQERRGDPASRKSSATTKRRQLV
uniref:Uncharacterized protein n=1 Tax=Odontella aurita TaxID=265563 RepID=A0A7S4N2H7_9STRA